MKIKTAVALLGAGVAVFLGLAFFAGEYRPPIFSGRRHPQEVVGDFLGFGWHFSRYFWLANSRDWPGANRQRLLAFWKRPDWSGFSDLREKSPFELGCWYERASLPGPASLLFLEACRREPGNMWLMRQSADKLSRMKRWDTLAELRSLILARNPENREIRDWVENNFPVPGAVQRLRDEDGDTQ